MKLKFWGVRGSIPAPIDNLEIKRKIYHILSKASFDAVQNEKTINKYLESFPFSSICSYGGNTFCVEIRDIDNSLLVFEAGTGLRNLSNSILHKDHFITGGGKANFVFSHTHWDRIMGFPFFTPFYIEDNQFNFYSPFLDLKERLFYLYSINHFSIPLKDIKSNIEFYHTPVAQTEIIKDTNFQISFKATEHFGTSYAVKIEEGEKKIIFTSDLEIDTNDDQKVEDYIRFFQDADILIFDIQYALEDYIQKFDKGHSNEKTALDIALRSNVKKLILSHYDPAYTDENIDTILLKTLQHKELLDLENKLEVVTSYENLTIEV